MPPEGAIPLVENHCKEDRFEISRKSWDAVPTVLGVVHTCLFSRNLVHTKDSRGKCVQKQGENQIYFSAACTEKLVCSYAPH